MQSLLNIDEYFVEELRVKINPEYTKDAKEETGEIAVAVSLKRKGKEPAFMISMRLELNKSKNAFSSAPYYILLDITGFFTFQDETDEETINKMIGLNGPVILYGVARGIVGQTTANFRQGKYVLPTLNLVEIMKNQQSKNVPAKRKRTKTV
jgi:preprotein translocase subunit SecB